MTKQTGPRKGGPVYNLILFAFGKSNLLRASVQAISQQLTPKALEHGIFLQERSSDRLTTP